jgi:hypothetical protein
MRYALLIYTNGARSAFDDLSPADQQAIADEYAAVMSAPGVYAGEQAQPPEAARTIRNRDGQRVVTEGPVEEKAGFGGFYLLESDSPEAAIEVASRIPAVRMGGAVEVRPLVAS